MGKVETWYAGAFILYFLLLLNNNNSSFYSLLKAFRSSLTCKQKVLKNIFFPFETSTHTYKRANRNTAQKPKNTTSTASTLLFFLKIFFSTSPNSLVKPSSQLIVVASDREASFDRRVSNQKWSDNKKNPKQNKRDKLLHAVLSPVCLLERRRSCSPWAPAQLALQQLQPNTRQTNGIL